MSKKKKLPKARQEALWAASLKRRGDIDKLIEQCIANGGECTSIAVCVGDACKSVPVNRARRRNTPPERTQERE